MSIIKYNHPIAESISRIIRNKGVKQLAIAEKAGFSDQAFSDMLNGRRVIKACDIPSIAKALGVTPNDLYGLTDQRTKVS